jgi:NSS family neurotransmitter:Na+ symporter
MKESFSSRFGLIAAALGMAIGAGNIWRFPRIAGEYGGSFIIPWMIFLFLWSIPLLLVEFSVGKKTESGVVNAFRKTMGKKFTWMGFFVVFCTSAIMFYYSVVCGWSLKYFFLSISGGLLNLNHEQYWNTYAASNYEPLFYHFVSLIVACIFIYLGIVKGIERFSKVIIPLLYLLLIVSAINAINLNGADSGLSFFFSFDIHMLADYKIWLDGLSQSAWSTGAGWGLILTYAIYSKKNEPVSGNVFITAFGNNFASILSGLVIIPTVFALSINIQAAHDILGQGNQGLAFIAIPQLFSQMAAGGIYSTVFFLALFFAALSSLISMLELASRTIMDFGINRKKAVIIIFFVSFLCGLPSAISLKFFDNQDWVWGLGLMVSGFFFTVLVIKIGVKDFVEKWFNPLKFKKFALISFRILFYFLLPLEFIAMLGWWFYQSLNWLPDSSWSITESFSLGTTLFQWTIILLAGIFLNKRINTWLEKTGDNQ